MTLTVTEIEVRIVVGEFPAESEMSGEEAIAVALVGNELLFGRSSNCVTDTKHGVDAFIEEVAGALDGSPRAPGASHPDDVFEVKVTPRALQLALRRLSAKHRQVDLASGELVYVDRTKIAYRAPCGEEFTFSRRDLERVVEEFA